jgi:hypothetical protein
MFYLPPFDPPHASLQSFPAPHPPSLNPATYRPSLCVPSLLPRPNPGRSSAVADATSNAAGRRRQSPAVVGAPASRRRPCAAAGAAAAPAWRRRCGCECPLGRAAAEAAATARGPTRPTRARPARSRNRDSDDVPRRPAGAGPHPLPTAPGGASSAGRRASCRSVPRHGSSRSLPPLPPPSLPTLLPPFHPSLPPSLPRFTRRPKECPSIEPRAVVDAPAKRPLLGAGPEDTSQRAVQAAAARCGGSGNGIGECVGGGGGGGGAEPER